MLLLSQKPQRTNRPLHEHAEGLIGLRVRSSRPVMSLAAQLQVFRSRFPGGFSGEAYRRVWRGQAGQPLQQHLDPDLARARSLLGERRMSLLMRSGEDSRVIADLIAVFAGTALIRPSRELRSLRQLDASAHPALASALHALLHGDGPLLARLQQWLIVLEQLGLPLTWAMATVPLALLLPDTAIHVRGRFLAEQARIIGRGGPPGRLPTLPGYRRGHETVMATQEHLRAAGLQPRDLLDIDVFILETLRPRGRTTLAHLSAA